MIYAQCWGDKREYSDKHYQTIIIDHVQQMPQKEKKRALEACFCLDRKISDLYVEKKSALSHFLDR